MRFRLSTAISFVPFSIATSLAFGCALFFPSTAQAAPERPSSDVAGAEEVAVAPLRVLPEDAAMLATNDRVYAEMSAYEQPSAILCDDVVATDERCIGTELEVSRLACTEFNTCVFEIEVEGFEAGDAVHLQVSNSFEFADRVYVMGDASDEVAPAPANLNVDEVVNPRSQDTVTRLSLSHDGGNRLLAFYLSAAGGDAELIQVNAADSEYQWTAVTFPATNGDYCVSVVTTDTAANASEAVELLCDNDEIPPFDDVFGVFGCSSTDASSAPVLAFLLLMALGVRRRRS